MNGSLNGRGTSIFPAAALLALGLLVLPASAGAQRPAAEATDAYLRELIPPAPAIHKSLKGDERLSKPVTVAMGDVPMADLLAELSKFSGVPLSASEDVADDMVIAGFKNHPLGSVLTLLSTHFGFTWRKKGPGYELWQDLASKQREEALRRAEAARMVGEALRRGRLAQQPGRLIEQRVDALRAASSDRGLASSIRGRIHGELRELESLSDPDRSFGLRLLAGAGSESIRRLITNGRLTLSTVGGGIAAPDAARWQEERVRAGKQFQRDPLPPLRELQAIEVVYQLTAENAPSGLPPNLQIEVRCRAKGAWRELRTTLQSPLQAPSLLATRTDPSLDIAAPAVSRSQRYGGMFRSGPYLAAWRSHLESWPDLAPSASDILLAIHRAAGLDLVGDDFNPWRPTYFAPIRKPVADCRSLLEQLCTQFNLAYAVDDRVLRVRHRAYYSVRPGAVPVRTVRSAYARLKPSTGSFLSAITAAVGSMNEVQQANLESQWGYFWPGDRLFSPRPQKTGSSPRLAQPALLAQMTAGVRRRLFEGERIPIESLTQRERDLLLQQLASVHREPEQGPIQPFLASTRFLELAAEAQTGEVYAQYDSRGRLSTLSQRSFPRGQRPPLPARIDSSPIWVPVGEGFPQTEYSLRLLDAGYHEQSTLTVITLTAPAPYPLPREQEADALRPAGDRAAGPPGG